MRRTVCRGRVNHTRKHNNYLIVIIIKCMPVVLKKEIGDAVVVLWEISEGEEELLEAVSPSDAASAAAFSNSARRMERLAWRAALRSVVSGGEVAYDATGAPRLIGEAGLPELHIASAHTAGMAAAGVSPRRCALDIESVGRDFSRASSRFMSGAEAALSDDQLLPAAVWCCKEALYKYSGRTGLDFLKDIEVTKLDLATGYAAGSVAGCGEVPIAIFKFRGFLVAAIA